MKRMRYIGTQHDDLFQRTVTELLERRQASFYRRGIVNSFYNLQDVDVDRS